jgi:ferritin-like metal-binding protein YciE
VRESANPKATRSVRASSDVLGGIMQTGHELFVHGLTDMLDGERQLVEALQELSDDSSNDQLKKAFASHRKETERQIERLTQCFELLGETPEETECKGLRGLIEEKKAFMEEEPESDILDVFQVGAAIKAETYEICEYKSLIEMAGKMGHTKVARLLRVNAALWWRMQPSHITQQWNAMTSRQLPASPWITSWVTYFSNRGTSSMGRSSRADMPIISSRE